MYSKERGYVNEPPAPRRLSYRQPDRPRMQVPPNYSGHAIVDGEERPLGRVEDAEAVAEATAAEGPIPHFDGLPRISELGESRYRPPSLTIPTASYGGGTQDRPSTAEGAPEDENISGEIDRDTVGLDTRSDTGMTSAKVAASPPALFSLSRFPFGRGIGWEELMILGLILFLLHESASLEDRGDLDETVILLGLLLLLG